MDDPWGSPWATTDATTAPSTSPSKNILEPPPPAFLSTPNNLNIPSSQSAWLDDDAFGDWSSPDPGQATNASPWTWGNEAAPIEGLAPSYEPRRKSSTPKWPQSRSASPGLRHPITPNTASPCQPSPDPWANHVSAYTRDEPEPLARLPQIPDVPPLVLEPPQVGLGLTNPPDAFEQDFVAHEPATTQFADPMPDPTREQLQFSDTPILDRFPVAVKQDNEAAPSSASASSEDGDDNDEALDARHADSPITSIEDNTTPRATQRKPSGKVLELVEMYDGIAKRRTVTPERVVPRRSASREPGHTVGEVRDQGNETDGRLETEKEGPPHDSTDSDSVDLLNDSNAATRHADETPRSVRPDHDPFEVDLGKLDLLLPDTLKEVPEPPEDVSDRIIHDSFTSISERKMWYRLSRTESLRKYNAGDDENYVRINWTNSTLRLETLKTVRRWIEEDSFGGRAFRGGSVRKAGGKSFGWDATTAASPVDLDRVFGRKQKRQASFHRPRHSMGGLPSLSTVSMIPGSTGNTPVSAQANGNWEGLAAFGWSSGTDDTKAAAAEAKASKPSAPGIPLPLAFTGFDNKPKSHASLPAFIKPIAPTPPTTNATSLQKENVEDDEDEWGDMVSPTTAEETDSTSLPKTSWDSFSTNPLPDVTSIPPSDGFNTSNPDPDVLRTGNKDGGDFRNKSALGDIGSVISPAPTSTPPAAAGLPHSQDGSFSPSASTYTFRPASSVKRPANISIAATLSDPLAPLTSAKTGVSAGGLVEPPPLTTSLYTPSTAQPPNSTEDIDLVHRFVRSLPDLSYMLR
ncbi:uncharacterized protein ColSpa_12320 [Colletotrichum spaethianum]|uniref:Glucan 4-alpha-glucosidase n=1 Tax=Colletotrichum spaethianum TaxID=700344 RepID=A0AA37UL31_9PEZI|nr:uncharacterized protein ColSpa_12320 [Colletotrichum spaethianum]GKT52139.1 hypothetical protein ColSpa_12320 [Colletotrichum spaethianum]